MRKKTGIIFISIIILLLIPLLTKNRSNPLANFSGVRLGELKFEKITFFNTTDQTQLGGMLFLPKKTEPFPIAIFIHGSGFSSRNNAWYLAIVKHLLDNDIAVLLPDKRGSEQSKGDWVGASPELLATDTESAIAYIKKTRNRAYSGIGLIGVSQGGWIAPIVAAKSDSLDFVVDISGTLATGVEQLYFEETNNIAQYTYTFLAKWIAKFSTKKLLQKKAIAPFANFDPFPYWKKVKAPAFIAFGENDTNCPVERSLEIIEEQGLKHLKVEVYPDGGHAILNQAKTGISEVFVEDLVQFIKKTSNENPIKIKIEKYLSNLEATGFSGAVLVDIKGEKIISKGYGFSDREKQLKNHSNTVFDIGSITKQFTAAGILKLEMMGKLSVEDKLSKYFPVPEDKAAITIHHLLTHSAGLPGGIGDDYENISTQDFLGSAFNTQLLFAPGEGYKYSNVGYSILAVIIEKISGKSYEHFLYENLWKPAGMEQTGYSRPDFKDENIAIGYHRNGKIWGKPNEQNWNLDAPFLNLKGNGGILSTAEDMYKWDKALKTDKILSADALEKYVTPYVKEGQDAQSYYAYGWAIYTTSRGTKLVAHNGGNGIFFADFWRYVNDGVTIIVLTNRADRYSRIIASQIGGVIFLPDFEPTYPSDENDMAEDFDQTTVIDFAKSTIAVLGEKDEKGWKNFIKNNGTEDFIKIAPMEIHLNYFSKFHKKLKEGNIKGIQLEDDELIITVETPNGMQELILNIEKNNEGVLKFGGMMVE